MSTILYRWGRTAARHPWRMIGAWLAIAVAVLALQTTVGGTTSNDWSIPGTEAQQGADLLLDRFPSEGGVAGRVVFADPDGDVTDAGARQAIAATLAELAGGPSVLAVTDPFDTTQPAVSPDGRIAFATVRYSVDPPTAVEGEHALEAIEIARDAGLQVELSREIVRGAEEVEGHTAETIGLAVAVVVLLVAFGSVIAAGIPIGTAVFGIMIGLGLVTTLSGLTDVPEVAPMIASMIGIGVGIDYALFVVTRHRGFRQEGHDPVESGARANATAGTAVLFAGSTVVVALAGLLIAGIPSIAMMGYAAALTVLVAMVAAVTLLPAFLGLAGDRIDRWRIGRRRQVSAASHHTWSGRWADRVGRRPWRFALLSFIGLVALAAPVIDMRTGVADDGTASTDHTYRRAYDLLAEGFGPGFNSPLTIAVDADGAPVDADVVTALRQAVATTDGVALVADPVVSPTGDTAVLTAFPTTGPADAETQTLVHTLRDEVVPGALGTSDSVDVYVTGQTAGFIDISEKLSSRLPLFITAVVGVSFLLLMLVFRSVLVPLKAAIMNLLSIGGAYGVVVAVFQWGWGNELIGVDTTVPISPFLPMIMFAILFGLSMDYEVFLLSRVREEYVRTGDSHQSVVDGLASTARVITSAALIMISVFAAFLLMPDVEVKMFAVGLSVAVLIDATVVRMVLVPSTMALMGDANWWLPGWLDRILPHVDVEGSSVLDAGREAVAVPDDLSELDELDDDVDVDSGMVRS